MSTRTSRTERGARAAAALAASLAIVAVAPPSGRGQELASPAREPDRDEAPAEPVEADEVEVIEVVGRLGTAGPLGSVGPVGAIRGITVDGTRWRSLPEQIAELPFVNAVDRVGNGRQLALDLRGFGGGEGHVALLADGVRLNEPDSGAAALELLPRHAVERVDVGLGPLGATLGGGSLAGAVRARLRRPSGRDLVELHAGLGSFGHREAWAIGETAGRRWGLVASGGSVRGDGFRDHAAIREDSAHVGFRRAGRRLSFSGSFLHLSGRWRQPGALTWDEWERDPSQATFNALDFTDATHDLLVLRLEGVARSRPVQWTLLAARRHRRSEVLTTGRPVPPVPGTPQFGFVTRDRVASTTVAAESTWTVLRRRGVELALRQGIELSDDGLRPRGFATDDVSDGAVDVLEPWADLRVGWRRAGAFVGLEGLLPRGLRLEVSVRQDWSRVERDGHALSSSTGLMEKVGGRRRFSGLATGLGLARLHEAAGGRFEWRVRWGESFLAPSSDQLFAYPGFTSNEELRPQRGGGWTAGAEWQGPRWRAGLELFRTDVRDEILFDESALQNVNATRTRRQGVELSLAWHPAARWVVRASHVATDATFRTAWAAAAGDLVERGDRVPLVPRQRSRLSLTFGPLRGLTAELRWSRHGATVLAGDFDNSGAELAARSVVSLSLSHRRRLARGSLAVGLSADDLLDAARPGRGVDAQGGPFVTPAPPRAVTVHLTWRSRAAPSSPRARE